MSESLSLHEVYERLMKEFEASPIYEDYVMHLGEFEMVLERRELNDYRIVIRRKDDRQQDTSGRYFHL